MDSYDAIIIGTGNSRATLGGAGMKVAIVERGCFGAHMASHAAEVGVEIDGEIKVGMTQVRIRREFVAGLFPQRERLDVGHAIAVLITILGFVPFASVGLWPTP